MSVNEVPVDQRLENDHVQNNNGTSKLFDELVASSKNLPSSSSDLGLIQLSYDELILRAKKLRNEAHNGSATKNYTKAHYLLAGSGISMEEFDSLYDTLRTDMSQETQNKNLKIHPISDVSSVASKELNKAQEQSEFRQNNILYSIEKLLSTTEKEFDYSINQVLNLDWDQRKEEVELNFKKMLKSKNIYNSNRKVNNEVNHFSSPNSQSNFDVNENQLTRMKFERYASIIYVFNNNRQNKQPFSLIDEYNNFLPSLDNENDKNMLKCCKILKSKLNNNNVVEDSKIYLENEFKQYLNTISIQFSRPEFNFSSNPILQANIERAIVFLNMKLKNKKGNWTINNLTVIDNVPVWALVFYLMRAGLLEEALEVLNKSKPHLKKIEQPFLAYFKAYTFSKDRKLPLEFVAKLNSEFNQHIKNSFDGDLFRLAVYKIIGKCDLSRKSIPSVLLTVEDWVWFHFILITDPTESSYSVYESFSLEEFQNITMSHGPNKLGNNYLEVLILCGLYSEAVQYLSEFDEINSVHLYISLIDKKLIDHQNKSGVNGINFASIINSYIRSFKFSDPRIAAEYITLITLCNDNEQLELCKEAFLHLVLDTKEFTILLGKVNRDGVKLPGVLSQRLELLKLDNPEKFINEVIQRAIVQADEEERVSDSLLLCQLSKQYDMVIKIINEQLSELLSESELDSNLVQIVDNIETNAILFAENLVLQYSKDAEIIAKIDNKSFNTTKLLIKISKARALFTKENWRECLSEIEALNIIPLRNELEASKGAHSLPTLDKYLIKNIPNILLMVMTCAKRIYENTNRIIKQHTQATNDIEELKKITRNCMIYAGTIQYKMPRDTYRALTVLDLNREYIY
ncbi:hypothetical protein TPHA_0P00480 [Tetrapisispora phaffii CBS 4417]|uniref:Nuclear pore protein n=1 Tax=Tetrapisispora phaffii (strain ATCC 24235 / CBS 4417 / NBRC 1672 / NRRL Y-8282 / UCD 70-5) TaxID=1071381 RepID=G8C228_TETPH|nr:hypothetical protein TPHA_0P00480 [Tetrapisispora phaffii CBS 4417]CCE66206.1 hypothetical protein TPHA_0P00480 [Tetrapisispora phaffii CBS 4417]